MSHPSVYPTGTTIYYPEKCYNGFTIFPANGIGAMLIDMNGAEVNVWKDVHGFPNKLLKGGYLMGQLNERPARFSRLEYIDLVQIDWDGNVVWKFDHAEYVEDPGEEPKWMARCKSDFQREGNPVGYYVPGMECKTDSGNTLILIHRDVKKNPISLMPLFDDAVIEVDWEGNIVWEWRCSDHWKELGFSEAARNAMNRYPGVVLSDGKPMGDWLHVNSMSVVGPNKWYDAGDERFHPDNIIWDSREANITAITSKKTGKIVWQLGPEYDTTPELKKLGWIIGQHHAHIIPRGLPGEGNLLIFDNGGMAGYGLPTPTAPTGIYNAQRDYSRVLEINPTNLEIVWQFTPYEAGYIIPLSTYGFYSSFISSAQRLPNRNTMICEGAAGRFLEVTQDHEIVWEYISPYDGAAMFGDENGQNKYSGMGFNEVYRSYRVPYDYCPQAPVPKEVKIERIDVADYRLPGAAPRGSGRVVKVEGTTTMAARGQNDNFCLSTDEQKKDIHAAIESDEY